MTDETLKMLEQWIRDNATRLAAEIVDPYDMIGTTPLWAEYKALHHCIVEPTSEDRLRVYPLQGAQCIKARVFFSWREMLNKDERAFRKIVSARLQELGDAVMVGWRKTVE